VERRDSLSTRRDELEGSAMNAGRISTMSTGAAALLAVLGLQLPAAAADGIAERVADLNSEEWTEKIAGVCGVRLTWAAPFPDLVFADRGAGCEVFAVDLTAGTATPVAHLGAPGADVGEYHGRIGEVTYFEGPSSAGVGTWRTDGTQAGTWLLSGPDPGEPWWEGEPFVQVGEPWTFFTQYRNDTGRELWRTDGTHEGTGPVIDLWPGPTSGVPGPSRILHDGLLYFAGRTPESGTEVWRSDGTAAGTVRLTDFPDGGEVVPGGRFAALPSTVLFLAPGSSGYRGLWRTDGTAAGTEEVWSPPTEGIEPWPGLTVAGSQALFVVHEWKGMSIWRTDGTTAGTTEVMTAPGTSGYPQVVLPLADESWLFFFGDPEHGVEPWISDGTPAGTHLWSEIRPGPEGVSLQHELVLPERVAAGIVLVVDDGTNGFEPWLFPADGSTPHLVADLTPGEDGSWIRWLGESDGLLLMAIEGDLWKTDGTGVGTALVAPLARTISPSLPTAFTDAGELLYFVARLPIENDGGHPGRTDGTEPGSRLLTGDYGDGNVVAGVSVLDSGTVIGTTDLGESSLIWSSQGDEAIPLLDVAVQCDVHHTCPIDYLPPGAGSVSLFAYRSPAEGTELWSLDGTPQGTQLFLDLLPGTDSSRPSRFLDVGDEVWFTAIDGAEVESLWRSEGTPGTTSPLLDLGGDPEARVAALWPIDVPSGRLYFLRDDAIGRDLWYVDSSASAPEIVGAGFGYGPFTWLGSVGEKVLFVAREAKDPGFGEELWVSDGTAIGTRLLRDIYPGPDGSSIYWSALLGDLLLFSACEPVAGCEVWRSDGTTAGTVRLLDLVPGAASSSPRGFTRIGDFVYFTAERLATGREIWATDGTAEGTLQLPEIAVGPWPSVDSYDDPEAFVHWHGRIYFAGDDGTGAELWAMPVLVFYDGFQTGDTARWSIAEPRREAATSTAAGH
jgi:ELWxxDGT repeat protein